MREYELMFVVDPRLTDEDTVALTDQYKEMIQSAGGVRSGRVRTQ